MDDDRMTIDELSETIDPQVWAVEFAKMVADSGDNMNLDNIVEWFDNAMAVARSHQWRDDSRDLLGTQEMLGHVLEAAGGKVVITQEQLTRGHVQGRQISIVENVQDNSFTFSLEDPQ